jgi:hypothetical protein
MKKFNHKQCFEFFNAAPKNLRWSWSARNSNNVVVTLWQDRFRRDDDGKLVYVRSHLSEKELNKPAYAEMVENLEFSRRRCNGEFNVILARAKDTEASTRQIEECWPVPGLRMKVRSFNVTTGNLIAEALA